MYQPMLYLHWKQIRFVLIPFIMAAFGLPLASVQGLGRRIAVHGTMLAPFEVIRAMQEVVYFYPLLAAAIGFTVALSAWNWDHQQGHVHSLSLPVSRAEYVMLKMGAGVLLAMLPILGLWAGAHIAVASIDLPVGLRAYPNLLALRFGLATLVAYGLMFALASGTIRTTVVLSTTVLAFFFIGGPLNDFLGLYYDFFDRHNVIEIALQALASSPGPAEIFTGNWTLIDV